MTVQTKFLALGLALVCVVGCLRKPADSNAPQSSASRPQANTNRPSIPNQAPELDNTGRRDGSIFVASSGAGSGVSSGGGSSTPAASSSSQPSNSTSGVFVNGLYPQVGTSPGGSTIAAGSGGFGGGLYPQVGSSASGNSASPFNPFGGSNQGSGSATGESRSSGADFSPANVGERGEANTRMDGTFMERAVEAFKDGNEALATSLLYAHFLADESTSTDYKLEWFPGLGGPRFFSRFGVGVTYSPYRGFQEAPPTIGEPYVAPNRQASSNPEDLLGQANQGGGTSGPGGRDVSKSPYANIDTSTPTGALLYYTGDFGERLFKRLNDRRKMKSMFGRVLTDMPEPIQRNTAPTSTASTSAPAAPIGGAPSRRDNPFVLGNMGGGTPPPPSTGDTPQGSGTETTLSAPAGAGTLAAKWSLTAPSGHPGNEFIGTFLPGVIILGEGKRDELLARAREHGIDLLLIFDVSVPQPPRNGAPYALISLRLVDVSDPDEPRNLTTTTQLNSQKVGETRSKQQNDRNDPVEVELDKIFQKVIDESFAASALPQNLNEENVSRQVERLIENKKRNPWLSAIEIVGYVRAGFLRESEAQDALIQLLGDESRVLISGSVRDRKAYLEEHLVQAAASKTSPSGSDFR